MDFGHQNKFKLIFLIIIEQPCVAMRRLSYAYGLFFAFMVCIQDTQSQDPLRPIDTKFSGFLVF